MAYRKPVVLRAADADRLERPWIQKLNPRAHFTGAALSGAAGLSRVGVSRARIPPGGESFAYHAHLREEEWIFIVSGRARGRFDGDDVELAAGDFAAFPAPQSPHLLTNPYEVDCVYLMGGERTGAPDVLEYPELDASYLLVRGAGETAFHRLGPAEHPFASGAAPWRVILSKACGSAIVEAAFAVAGIPYVREEIDYDTRAQHAELVAANPLAQIPTVIAPDGAVLTESAALVQVIDELVPTAGLLPAVGDPLRREALRWLTFLVAAVYPTFTYGDEPAKWQCGDELRTATNAHRESLWRYLDSVAKGPWFLGARWSMLDVYVSIMSRWRPNRPWFAEHAKTLSTIAEAVDRDARLAEVWRANGW